eukprot:1157027-Pelagomonas_calceolata.AAC.5
MLIPSFKGLAKFGGAYAPCFVKSRDESTKMPPFPYLPEGRAAYGCCCVLPTSATDVEHAAMAKPQRSKQRGAANRPSNVFLREPIQPTVPEEKSQQQQFYIAQPPVHFKEDEASIQHEFR